MLKINITVTAVIKSLHDSSNCTSSNDQRRVNYTYLLIICRSLGDDIQPPGDDHNRWKLQQGERNRRPLLRHRRRYVNTPDVITNNVVICETHSLAENLALNAYQTRPNLFEWHILWT